MTNLIEISNNKISNETVKTVNARELHSFLEVSTKFSDWIQRRISEYDFVEDVDFVVLLKNEKNHFGGRPLKEIYISIDMAKELSMVERNEKGRQARQYFIEMEKVAKKQIQESRIALPDFTNPAESARAWAEEYEKRELAEQKLIEAQPKIEFVQKYVEVGTTKSLRETAKILKMPERTMIDCLVGDGLLFRQSGNLLPYQKYHAKGLFDVKTGTTEHGHNYTQTRVTSKGIEYIASRYASELMQ